MVPCGAVLVFKPGRWSAPLPAVKARAGDLVLLRRSATTGGTEHMHMLHWSMAEAREVGGQVRGCAHLRVQRCKVYVKAACLYADVPFNVCPMSEACNPPGLLCSCW